MTLALKGILSLYSSFALCRRYALQFIPEPWTRNPKPYQFGWELRGFQLGVTVERNYTFGDSVDDW